MVFWGRIRGYLTG